MLHKKLVVLLFITIMVSSCKKDPAANEDFDLDIVYEVDYNSSRDKTYLKVTFTRSDAEEYAPIELNGNQSITYGGQELTADESNVYTATLEGLVEASYRFEDEDGLTYENTIEMIDSVYFTDWSDSVKVHTNWWTSIEGPELNGDGIRYEIKYLNEYYKAIWYFDNLPHDVVLWEGNNDEAPIDYEVNLTRSRSSYSTIAPNPENESQIFVRYIVTDTAHIYE